MKKLTKKLQGLKNNYDRSTNESLYDCYDRPSSAKLSIFKDCEHDKIRNNGFNAKIISFNGFIFSYGYLFDCPVNGNLKLKVITKSKDYEFDY